MSSFQGFTGKTVPASGNLFGSATAAVGGSGSTGGTGTSSNIFGSANTGGNGKATTGTPSGGLFGTSTSGSGPAAGGNPFGAMFGGGTTNPSTNTGANPPSASSNPLFPSAGGSSTALGSGSGLFGAPKPAEQGNGSTPKPAMPSFFPQQSTSTSTFTASASAPSGGLFGSTLKPTGNTATSTSGNNALGGGLFGGGLFGQKSESAPSASTPAAPATTGAFLMTPNKDAAPAAPSGGLFGNLGAAKDKAPQAAATPAFNLFGGAKDTSGEKKDAPAALPAFSLGGSSASNQAEKPQGTLGLSAASTVSVPPPSALRGKTIEDIVNKWSTELEVHVREFNKFAGEVAVWDRALIENSNTLASLYNQVLTAEREQNDIDQSLDHIEQQQKDLSATLDAYEKSTQEILGSQGGSLRALDTGPADTERDQNYMLATELHTHLDDLSTSLTQLIDSVNSHSQPLSGAPDASSAGGEDPMTRITQILSSHLESLQWVDGAVREVENRVTDVEKRLKDSSRGSAALGGNNGARSRNFGLHR